MVKKMTNKNKFKEFYITKNIYQNEKGMYKKEIKGKDKKEVVTLIGRIYIKQIIITKDALNLFEPVYTIKFFDIMYQQEKTIEDKTFDTLTKLLNEESLFTYELKYIRSLIKKILIKSYGKKINGQYFIVTETRVFKEGFFIKDGKVVENTPITGLKPTKNEIKESIKLVNKILKDRGSAIPNDCTVFRFMLWAPFGWCIKDIGKSKKMYGLVLTGTPKTNKTGSCENFSWLYSNPTDRNNAVSTTSVFGSRLEESTLPAIIDEAYTLLIRDDMHDPMKNCIYNKQTRSTKDKSNPQDTLNYLALGLPIFTMNEYIQFKSYITRRYHFNHYTPDMVVDEDKADNFEIKYAPEFEESPLKTLRFLGRAFADKFIPYIENHSKKLFDLERLTVAILKEIAEEVGEDFNEEVYKVQASVDTFEVDKCSTIRSGLNNLFRTKYGSFMAEYTLQDFITCSNNGTISWLYYRKSDNEFVINKKGFEKEISEIVGENLDYETILKELEIYNIFASDKAIHTNRGNTRGFKIKPVTLMENIFDVKYQVRKNKK